MNVLTRSKRNKDRKREKKTTHWNVDYSRYTNLISNSIHQTLHFFFVCEFLCLEFSRFFISFIHLFRPLAMIWISLSLAAGAKRRKMNFHAFTYDFCLVCFISSMLCSYRLSPTIHHLRSFGMRHRKPINYDSINDHNHFEFV